MTAGNARRALLVASSATFLSFLDSTVTNLAVPPVAAEFNVSLTTVAWIATAYVIPFAAFLAPAGVLADAAGRCRLFMWGVAVFTASSLVIALAPSFGLLLAARGLQGVGAAVMVPASLALVLAEIPAERRRAAIGLWSAAGALAAAAGPALGGVVVQTLDWRVLFCLNVPIGLWVLIAARPMLANETRSGKLPDLLGALLLAVGIGSVIYALTEGPDRGWTATRPATALGVAVIAIAAATLRSARHDRPALRLDLLWGSPFAMVSGISAAYGAGLFSSMFTGVLFLVQGWGYSALEAGLAMTPAALVTAVVGIGVGRLPVAFSPRSMIVAGALPLAASTALLAATISATPQFLLIWLPLGCLMGVGVGLLTVGISSAGAVSAPMQHFAAATGLLMAARQCGGALGIAVAAVLLAVVIPTTLERPFVIVYWLITGVTLLAAVGGVLLRAPYSIATVGTASVSAARTGNR
ncbi:MFS transporter [Micromonospora sp. RTGN7]|uniref:MFS transporter n=1 Tax=Micromonospora sp. RTGN7 TaxID=3016526 RepID=UPI0029FF4FBB|nr:MFS transporter [Micromonospora sp. RTGN7]